MPNKNPLEINEELFVVMPYTPRDAVPGFMYFVVHVRKDYAQDVYQALRYKYYIADVDLIRPGSAKYMMTNDDTHVIIVAISPRFYPSSLDFTHVLANVLKEEIHG